MTRILIVPLYRGPNKGQRQQTNYWIYLWRGYSSLCGKILEIVFYRRLIFSRTERQFQFRSLSHPKITYRQCHRDIVHEKTAWHWVDRGTRHIESSEEIFSTSRDRWISDHLKHKQHLICRRFIHRRTYPRPSETEFRFSPFVTRIVTRIDKLPSASNLLVTNKASLLCF